MRKSLMLAATAIALAGASIAQPHFPTGISDGPRRVTRTRKKVSVTKYKPDNHAIANWNKEVERKKAEKRAAKAYKAFR